MQVVQKGPDVRRRGSEERGVLGVRCNDERRSQRRRWAFFNNLLALRNDSHPPTRTLLHVRIIRPGILAVVPVLGWLRWCGLRIYRRGLLDDHRRGVDVIIRGHVDGSPPDTVAYEDARPDKHMGMASMVSLPSVALEGAAEKQDDRHETYPNDFSHDTFPP